MSLPDVIRIAQVVLGIGLVIFVHELGHFLAARWAGARVEVFSIGFGPRLFGWRRGDTMFQVAALPLGGYVKLAGEYPESGRRAKAGELGAMSVFHRLVYYSGGVVMNVVFALVVIPLVLFVGYPVTEPVVGAPVKGSAAWRERIEPGSRILSANGRDTIDFLDVATEVMLSGKKPVDLVLVPPGESAPTRMRVQAEYNEFSGAHRLGVAPAYDPALKLVVVEGGAAEAAGLTSEDALAGVAGESELLAPEAQLARALSRGGAVTLRIRRGGEVREVVVEPEREATKQNLIGVSAIANLVAEVREGPGGEPGPAQRLGLRAGDRITSVGGAPIHRADDFLAALLASSGPLRLEIVRDGEAMVLEGAPAEPREKIALDEDVHLTQDLASSRVAAQPGRPAALAGVRDGDRVISVNGRPTEDWNVFLAAVQRSTRDDEPVELEIWRDVEDAAGEGEHAALLIEVEPARAVEEDYGFGLGTVSGVWRADGIGEALGTGFVRSWRWLVNTWTTLRKMVTTDEVSTKNLGGIITISVVSFDTAGQGLATLFFFLAILSINLAVLNLLPIPLLDGGHLLFLIVEWIKGSPVSERTLGYSQVVGMVLLLSLMIYVTYQDVLRWIIR